MLRGVVRPEESPYPEGILQSHRLLQNDIGFFFETL